MITTNMTRNRRAGTLLAALAATALTLSACGGDAEEAVENAADTAGSTSTAANQDGGHDGHSGHSHSHEGATGDPNATPANEIEGADLTEGTFNPLESAPAGTESVSGVAYVARHDEGTTVTIDVEGLQPEAAYMSHLHAQPCAEDDGGPHFRFDEKGSEKPPNEVHIAFTADADGAANTTVSNDNPNSEGAKSIVLHLDDEDGTKFACADL
ncbi:superoxide dismutase family protein [Haloechinothrix halophila]|uniref:superoxide dismutase family protein n=1 Tax=Haloechinothrix halophila TaxID=1069073 RepID=UPI0009FE62D0|nr:superoxide dismutase family protein [Haloechinothrix halophila]